jgi:hypothetical protein
MKKAVTLVSLVSAAVLTTTTASAAGGARVEARGHSFSFEPNEQILDTLHWHAGVLHVHSGDILTIADSDQTDEPHVFTIVRRGEKPRTIDELFSETPTCTTCMQALAGHDPNGDQEPPFIQVVNKGKRGLDTVGDSYLLLPGKPIRVRITAPAGTTLNFICSIHNQMQGVMHVMR